MSPSFIVDTWRIWEWLITIALRVGLGNRLRVIPQATIQWGVKKLNGKSYHFNVFPDVAIYNLTDSAVPIFLVDAKYKVLTESTEIERADLYEAFAFCHATGAKKLFLAYPTIAEGEIKSGNITNVSNYEIEDVTISAIQVAFGFVLISRRTRRSDCYQPQVFVFSS